MVIDDGSRTPVDLSAHPGVRVIRHERSHGPAAARNRGAAETTGAVLVFVDADVEVGRRTIEKLSARMASDTEIAAVQTIYSADCPVEGFASQFQNLLQRYNFNAVREPDRFCGLSSYCVAIRRDAFEAAGGFDAEVTRATVEDENLAYALLSRGHRVFLARDIEVSHHAQLTVGGLARRMGRMASDKLQAVVRKPARAAIAPHRTHHRPGFLASVVLAPIGCGLLPTVPPLGVMILAFSLAVNLPFLFLAARQHGPVFATGAAGMMLLLPLAAAVGSLHGLLSL